jgi:CRISPR/Cas system CMR subunit Cmr4 (Cas7 group RAMP superfamily)
VYQGELNSLLIDLNKLPQWRVMYGLPMADVRMRDIEFILRFFALSSDRMKAEQKEGISLKRFLNVFMDSHRNLSNDEMEAYRSRFTNAIIFLHDAFGDAAFHNLSSTNPDRLVKKFNPTIFDSILIATDFALSRNHTHLPADAERGRRLLLSDEDYRNVITKETMRVVSIRTRIKKATKMLFGLNYE